MATTNTRIVIRRDVSTTWSSINPELLTGEQGLETDTGKFKIGEGKTWSATGYATYLPSEVDAKVSDEATIRAGVDSTLQTDLNGAKARIDVLEADPTTVTEVDAKVAAEATARAAADTTLQGNIDTVDGRVNGEISARGAADDVLDAAIAINTVAISDEVTARQLADGLLSDVDTQLDNRVTTLEAESATTAALNAGLAAKADVTALAAYTTTADLDTLLGDKADTTALAAYTTTTDLDLALADKADADADTAGNADTATLAAEASRVSVGTDRTGTPSAPGLFVVDGGEVYISVAANSAADWKQIS